MKKTVQLAIVFILLISVMILNTNEASAATTKVMWGKTELKVGQIGKVTILAKTSLWKLEKDNSLTKIRDLKKGEEYRVYSYKSNNGGLYGVGGGAFVQKNASVKYETPSKSKLILLKQEAPLEVISVE
jgi:TldD protein